jgi:hypothetical protein
VQRQYLKDQSRMDSQIRDLKHFNRTSGILNSEAAKVLAFQIPENRTNIFRCSNPRQWL